MKADDKALELNEDYTKKLNALLVDIMGNDSAVTELYLKCCEN